MWTGPLIFEPQLPTIVTPQPAPVLLSPAQRDRLGGGSGGVRPLIRHRWPFDAANHSYWQDPARPWCFFFLPDRFLLARETEGKRRPILRVLAAAPAGDGKPRFTFEFVARPVVDMARLEAARPELERLARASAIELEILNDPQPVLRLALPQNGAQSSEMTERPDAYIDLEAGLAHAETLVRDDFLLVYQALFGVSLTLLLGDVRAATGGAPEDVPLELRIDKTIGDVLAATAGASSAEGLGYRLVNVIESPVRIDRLSATAKVGDKLVRLRTLVAGQRLAPGEGFDVVLEAEEPIAPPGPDAIVVDQSGVVVEPDADAVWAAVLDRSPPQGPLHVTVAALPLLFDRPPDRPDDDRVAAFVVTIENGGTVQLTAADPHASTTVSVPLEPFIKGGPLPPIRYLTETWWVSDDGTRTRVGTSDWREVNGTVLYAVKTPPA